MRGLKISDLWLSKILSGEKTMEIRSIKGKVNCQRIALGNSTNHLVEEYAIVQDIFDIPLAKVSEYQDKHLATQWLLKRYSDKGRLNGYLLTDVKREDKQFLYQNAGVWFQLEVNCSQNYKMSFLL